MADSLHVVSTNNSHITSIYDANFGVVTGLDFQSNSPAIDAGTDLGFIQHLGAAPDISAYERQ